MMDASRAAGSQSYGLFLVFSLDDQLYGVPVRTTKEILPMVEITAVPKAPPFIKGVINLRGLIVPIVDLRRKLKLKDRLADSRTCMVIAELSEQVFGFLADRVTDCLEIANIGHPEESEIALPPEKKQVSGIGQHPAGIIILLDPENLFSASEKKILKSL